MASSDAPSAQETMQAWARRPGRAVLFDFNGTLSDDEPILLRIFTGLFAEHLDWRMSEEEYGEQLLGHSDREIVEFAVREHGNGDVALVETLLDLRRRRYLETVATHSPITTGAAEFVEGLAARGVPMAIVTGAQREDVVAVLDGCSTGRHINLLVTVDDVQRGKPDPEGFMSGAALLDVDPADVLVFEDSVPGIRAARAAGMNCIAVVGDGPRSAVVAEGAPIIPCLSADLLRFVTPAGDGE